MGLVINVREVLHTHSQSTTLKELEARGRARVRVINANQIAELIEESVRATIARAGGDENLLELIEKSKTEFKEIVRQRDLEREAREEGLRQLEAARSDMEKLAGEVARFREAETEQRERISVVDRELAIEKVRLEETRRLVDALGRERDAARAAEAEARAAAAAVQARPSTESTELLSKLAAEVARLSERIDAAPATAPAGSGADSAENAALHQRLETLSSGISEKLEKFGRSIGVSSAVEVDGPKYDALFEKVDSLESNMGTVEVKQRKGSGIGGVLERMKKMRLRGASPEETTEEPPPPA